MDPIIGTVVSSLMGMVAKAFGLDTESDDTKVKLATLELQAQALVSQQLVSQASIDQAEASSGDKFTSRWRPFVGWVCGFAFAYHFIIQPVLVFLMAVCGKTIALPGFDMNTLTTVLMGLLGLGTLHTYENMNSKSK